MSDTTITTDTTVSIVLANDKSWFLDAFQVRPASEPAVEVVASVRTGMDVIRAVERFHPDVVVMAEELPTLDPIEVAKAVANRAPSPRMLYTAPYLHPAMVVAALVAGITGFLEESSSPNEIARAIQCVVRGETWIPPRVLGPTISLMLRSREEAFSRSRVLDRLSRRERTILALVARGQSNESMAELLNISPQTAKTHVQNIMQKLEVHSRNAAAAFAMKEGIIDELDRCR